jgi:sulfite exporter TauE/SafE
MISSVVLASALVMGLAGGTHCIVMCGGVVGALSAGMPEAVRARPLAQLRYLLLYNAGRIASYAAAGAIGGGIGALADRIDALRGAQIGLRFFAGAIMLAAGLYLAGAFRRFASIEKVGAPVWRHIQPIAARLLPVRSGWGALGLGALWGWMPCGMVYAAVALAVSSGSTAGGAATLVAFGVGTLPALLTMGAFAGALARAARRVWVRRGAGVAIAAFGLVHLVTVTTHAGLPSSLGSPLVPSQSTPNTRSTHDCCPRLP